MLKGDKCYEEIKQGSAIVVYMGRGEVAIIEGLTERVIYEQRLQTSSTSFSYQDHCLSSDPPYFFSKSQLLTIHGIPHLGNLTFSLSHLSSLSLSHHKYKFHTTAHNL